MADTRNCEQCGTVFSPRREHARFCSARCRVAWNGEHTGDLAAGMSALGWSVGAMGEAVDRLSRVQAWDPARAFGAVSEVVWWVTIVDATMVRYYPDTYDKVLAGRPQDERRLIEGTLGGLRFVRNQIGCADQVDFVHPDTDEPGGPGITGWTWNAMPKPALSALRPRGQSWEMRRYRAYENHLAGHTIGETFERAAEFLRLAAGMAAAVTDPGAHATR